MEPVMKKDNKYKWEQHMLYASESDDLAEAEKEWLFLPNSYVPDGEDNCLCSARIKNKFKIVNLENKHVAFVGSSCLRKIIPPGTKIGSSLCRTLFTSLSVEYDNLDIDAYLRHCASICGSLDLQMAQEKLELELERKEQHELQMAQEQQRNTERLKQWEQQEQLKRELKREREERKEDPINGLSYKEWALVLSKRKNTTYEIEKAKIDLLFS